jgi:CheY-like chemotaxis protein
MAWSGVRFSDRDKDAESPSADTQPPEEARAGGASFHALVIDDAEDARYIYQHYFEFCGLRVTTASDGAAALVAVARERPDVIVLDLAMPKITGWEVLERLRAEPGTRAIPVVVVSGQQERTSAIVAGADAYCEKPCLPDQVLSEARRVLRRAREKSGGLPPE